MLTAIICLLSAIVILLIMILLQLGTINNNGINQTISICEYIERYGKQ